MLQKMKFVKSIAYWQKTPSDMRFNFPNFIEISIGTERG